MTISGKKYSTQKKILYLVMITGVLLLFSANITAWIFLQRIKVFFISDLKFRLENIIRSSALLVDAADLELIIPGDVNDTQVIFYQQILYQIKEDNRLQDILIIAPDNEILIDPTPGLSSTDQRRLINNPLIRRGMNGEFAIGDLQTLGAHRFLTAVLPLFNDNNIVTGILLIEAPAEFFDLLDQFDKGLIIFSLINSVVILSVAFLFFRSFRRVVKLQDQIKNQEHLVKLGEMAAAVAHELRNPLTIINGTNTLIQKKYGQSEDEFFNYIPGELERLNKLIEDFLTFSRNKEINVQKIVISDFLTRIKVGFVEYDSLEIETDIDRKAEYIYSDPAILEQILLNAINNAIQAVSEKGTVAVSVNKEARAIRFSVKDSGKGISDDIKDRIFEPFFSTKETGSGLGLAISQRLAEQLGGEISIKSHPGNGTTFSLILPVRFKS